MRESGTNMGCSQGGLPGREGCLSPEGLKDTSTLVQWGAREGFKQGNNLCAEQTSSKTCPGDGTQFTGEGGDSRVNSILAWP